MKYPKLIRPDCMLYEAFDGAEAAEERLIRIYERNKRPICVRA